jgi:hypothetical protein
MGVLAAGRLRPMLAAASLAAVWAAPAAAQSSPTPSGEPPAWLFGAVPGEPSSVDGAAAADETAPSAVADPAGGKRGEFLLAPVPIVNPTLENGLFLLVGYLYRIDLDDRKTPPSVSAVGGFKTSNGSWAGTTVHSLHLGRDRFRILGLFAYSDVNYQFFGIGQGAGDAGRSVELNQAGPVALVEGLVRIRPKWYVGARWQGLKMTVGIGGVAPPDAPAPPAADLGLRTAALGPRFQYDSRENPFYARQGAQVDAVASFFGTAVGGQRSYQQYQAFVNRYHALGARNVLAWHAGGCAIGGDAPFYDLCLLGKSQDLRGYPVGQYRDRAMVAAQAELRSELWWRIGAAVFAGAGAVAPRLGRLSIGDTLPGAGAGLRFTLAKQNHVNLRVDYAWGRDSSGVYVGVAEAF